MEYLNTVTNFIAEWYWIPATLIYIGVFITILLENRNPSKSLAYILVLVFLPGIGLIVYYFFGRDFRKKKLFTFKGGQDVNILREYWQQRKPEIEHQLQELEAHFQELAQPAQMLYNEGQSDLSSCNEVDVLINGEEKFPELYRCLEAAAHHIHLEYYMLSDDDVGNRITDILIKKAGQGVEVRVIADGTGSSRIGRLPKRLRAAGIPIFLFMPVRFTSLASTNYRNHRKIAVIDGHTGFVGGLNLDDRYWNTGKHKLFWRDTHLKIQGPAVRVLQLHFLLSWQFVSKQAFPIEPKYFPIVGAPDNGYPVSIVASGPDTIRPFSMDCYVSAIHRARQRVRITNPYFIPSQTIIDALQIAASSGVKVQLILPGVSDSWIVQHASYSYLKPLLENGVEVFLYKKGFVHAKTITVDGKLAMIGSVNMDFRSFFINFEVAALIYAEEVTRQLDDQFDQDLQECEQLNWRSWKNRPIIQRGVDSLCRLLAPIL